MDHVLYLTNAGDRWDTIAWKHYGDPYAFERIIAANPTVPITPTLAAGVKLAIPIVARATVDAKNLPPWKR